MRPTSIIKRGRSAGTETAPGAKTHFDHSSEKSYRQGGMQMPNNLKELRLKTKTPAKEMVAVVQTIYPKYDMTSQSKCENSDAYGVCLTQKAMKLLYA